MKKNRISKKALKAYITIRDRVRRCKSNMIKLPFEDPKKQQEMIDNNELLLRDSMKMLAKLSKWWLDDVISLLNKPREAPVITDSAKDKKTGKNPNPNPKKKGGKE